MKGLSKPLSSPSRGDKFPPPLMRFLRSNVGSRSRGRSRSSPLFYLRTRKSAPAVIEPTQEPSSPKVTCIGQVRVRRSAKSSAAAGNRRRRCWWRKKALFFGKFRSGKKAIGRMFCRFFRAGYCKKVDATTEDSFRVYSNSKSGKNSESDDYSNKYGSREIKRGFIESSSNSSPPRNALMLMRCRSAPYRSSSLGGRFWGSPLAEKEEGDEKTEQLQNPSSENVEEEEEEERSEKSSEECKVIGGGALHQGVGGGGGGGAVHPLLLTRCKSEPARTGERLNPEPILLRQKLRLDDVQPRSQQNS